MITRHGYRWVSFSASGLSALVLSTPVFAQNAQLEEVVVTAQRTETNLQSTPLAVTAVTSETLAQRGVTTLSDLGEFTPSLTVVSQAGAPGASSSFAIRGMGVNTQGSNPAVGLYLDGVYFPSSFGNGLGLLDVERLEVLRGPQGTLFGRNTIAGAIQYISVKPSDTFGSYVEGEVGNQGHWAGKGAINVPFGDKVEARLAVSKSHEDGYVYDELNRVKRGADDTDLARLQIRIRPVEALTIDLKADYAKTETNGRALQVPSVVPNGQFVGLASVLPPPETRPLTNAYVSTQNYTFDGFNSPDYFTAKEKSFAATVQYDISDKLTAKSITAYNDNENHIVSDIDATPLSILSVDRGINLDTVFTQEFQLTGKSFGDRLSWTSGLYYYDGQRDIINSDPVLGVSSHLDISSTRSTSRAEAVYVQGDFKLSTDWSLIAGLRYSREKAGGKNLLNGLSKSAEFDDVTPRVGLDYQVTQDIMLYASAAKGFRAGGFTINSRLPGGSLAYEPETAWTYELGARMEFLDRRLRVNPTLFYTDWEDLQFNLLIPVGNITTFAIANAGKVNLKGIELESQFAVTGKFQLTGSFSYLDAKYVSVPQLTLATYPFGYLAVLGGVPGSVVVVQNLGVDDELQQAPKYKYSIGGVYTQPFGAGHELIGSLDWGWTDDQQSAVTRSDALLIPAYGLLNGRLEFVPAGGRWSVALYGKNLLDKFYLIGAYGFGDTYTSGANEIDPGRPREYGLTVRAKF